MNPKYYITGNAKKIIEAVKSKYEDLSLPYNWYECLFYAIVEWSRLLNRGLYDIVNDNIIAIKFNENDYMATIPDIGVVLYRVYTIKDGVEIFKFYDLEPFALYYTYAQFITKYYHLPIPKTSSTKSSLLTDKIDLGNGIYAIKIDGQNTYELSGKRIKFHKKYDEIYGKYRKFDREKYYWVIAKRDNILYKVDTAGREIPYSPPSIKQRKYLPNVIYNSNELAGFYEKIRESKFKDRECIIETLYDSDNKISREKVPTLIEAFTSILHNQNIQFKIEISPRGSFVVSVYPIDNTDKLIQLSEIFVVKLKEKQRIDLTQEENFEKIKKLFENKESLNLLLLKEFFSVNNKNSK